MLHAHSPSSPMAVMMVAIAFLPATAAEPEQWQAMPSQNESGEFPGWQSFSEDQHAATADVWRQVGERLTCTGSPRGYLYTKQDYTDFVLQLQWRWTSDQQPGSGGVLLRMTGPHKIWPKSLEAQINAGDAGDFWGLDGYRLTGAAERLKSLEHPQFGDLTNVRKMRAMERPPGEWNEYEITAQQDVVTLRINGELVNRATRCDITPGKICLTAEGTAIEFRKIRWRPLDASR